jgi:hypothetical protein
MKYSKLYYISFLSVMLLNAGREMFWIYTKCVDF